ncbi:uncharacterized protein LOC113795892 [Dermatophagoides pteronyssinus]|uniref:uncharacterized protein LOC113795892 n=1 Tax=Dermatophagoides pteronyssinus TaxID=6956 RepID=UPI003F671AFB
MSESTNESSEIDPKEKSIDNNDDEKSIIDQSKSNDANDDAVVVADVVPESPSPSSSSSFGGWFSNIVQQAKQTVSKTTMESIRRDLSELKDAVQNDTTNMVYSTASLVKNTFNEIGNTVTEIGSMGTNLTDEEGLDKQEEKPYDDESIKTDDDDNSFKSRGLSFDMKNINLWTNKLTDTAKTTINLMKDTFVDTIFTNEYSIDELNDEPYVVVDGEIIKIENWLEHLRKLQSDPNTYCREPVGPPDNFEQWLARFNLNNHQKQMEYLLMNITDISKYYDEFVPDKLSEEEFWNRYFYNVYQLRQHLANEQIQKQQQQCLDKTKDEKPTKTTTTSTSISPSETDEWEKMNNNSSSSHRGSSGSNSQKEIPSSKCSSDDGDDDRNEWVKM